MHCSAVFPHRENNFPFLTRQFKNLSISASPLAAHQQIFFFFSIDSLAVMPEENATPVVPEKAEAPASAPDTPLAKLTARLADIIQQSGHSEMWGVELSSDASHAPTQVILQKFLRANNGDLAGAEKQLAAALAWRQKWQPTKLVSQAFSKDKFGGLGFVTNHKDDAGNNTVITWNIYGSVKDNKATFGDVTE